MTTQKENNYWKVWKEIFWTGETTMSCVWLMFLIGLIFGSKLFK